jgi:hypothetical protein
MLLDNSELYWFAGQELFYGHVHLHGGPAPVRRYLPQLIELVWERKISPGKVFDLMLPLDQVAEGYHAMDAARSRRCCVPKSWCAASLWHGRKRNYARRRSAKME